MGQPADVTSANLRTRKNSHRTLGSTHQVITFRDITIAIKKKLKEHLGLHEAEKKTHKGYQASTFGKSNKDNSVSSAASSHLSPMYTPKDLFKK